ncbi:hypothetical protein DEJ23_00560 [Curtobacterium sp. MCSS17_008]|uniref:hypothetical protein n=1 Tax=Curtobacterium sp. MCSS17_008 TaxID=2175647 RepID=UPI000DA88327|nr:hypothetical protein [Curtobacterium sp. MCSS17_008]PZF59570.1 hypothetical protein DEJ23_00560 [Curtobacterium sp. MCSS17_008]
METKPGARTPLVDPFGRELEQWLRDVPVPRTPYLADLVVPPVTGPVQRPVTATDAPVRSTPVPAATEQSPAATEQSPAATEQSPAVPQVSEQPVVDQAEAPTSFRRRDRARHVAACAPSFPEPPARLALRIEDLAVEVSASSGRTTVERIELLEDEVRRRDEDLARLAAWEVAVADLDDAEVEAARAFASAVFADLLADAADEAERRDRAAARRAATASVPTSVRQAVAPRSASTTAGPAPALRSRHVDVATMPAVESVTVAGATATTDGRDEPVRPVLSLQARTPVSANTRPTPLVQPATGPTVIDRAAFAAALTAHVGTTASTPVVLPEALSVPSTVDDASTSATTVEGGADDGWWTRLVTRLRALFGRR